MHNNKIVLLVVASALLASCGGQSSSSSSISSSAVTSSASSQGGASVDSSAEISSASSSGEKYLFYTLKEGVKASEMEGTPWVNTATPGRAAKVEKPSLKDDYYLATTYDMQINANLGPDDLAYGGTVGAIGEVSKKTTKMLTEKTSSKFSDAVTTAYTLYAKEDKADEIAYNKALIDEIKNISNTDQLFTYLTTKGFDLRWPLFQMVKIADDQLILKDLNMGLTPASLGYYTASPDEREKLEKAEATAVYLLGLYGYSETDARALAKKAFLAEFRGRDGSLSDGFQTTVGEVNDRVGNLKLKEYFNGLGYADTMNLQVFGAVALLLKAITDGQTLSLDEIKALLINRIAFSSVFSRPIQGENGFISLTDGLNDNTRGYNQDMYLKSIFDNMITNVYDRVYIDNYETKERKASIASLMGDVANEYVSLLDGTSWLEEATRTEAKEKVKAMKFDCCYPSFLEELPDFSIAGAKSYMEVVDRYTAWSRKANQPSQTTYGLWNDASVTVVNAIYNGYGNSFVIFDGMLANDNFSTNMSKEELYGSVGQIIGHEISHGFDVNGSKIDKEGQERDWWTAKDKAAFQTKVDKITNTWKQYTNKKDMPLSCDDGMLGEIIADMGGISVTLRLAAKESNFDYGKYFNAYSNSMGSVISEALLENMVYGGQSGQQDSHPLSVFRVNGVVSQFAKFYETYGIKDGDHMYVAEANRLNIWG